MIKIFENLSNLQKSLLVSIVSIILFIASASVSYSYFLKDTSHQQENLVSALPSASTDITEDPQEPKTEECPLNGAMHGKSARINWESRLPLAVMIENSKDARPQSGISSSDIVYEAVAEGGITRFMAVYLCNLADTQVGPVRSARTYYLDWLSEYDALYAHVGGANTPGPANALGQIIKYNIRSLNQFGIGFPTYWRDYERLKDVATEHTMYSTTRKLWDAGSKKGWINGDSVGGKWQEKFVKWQFKIDSPSASPNPEKIEVGFWASHPDFTVLWQYDKNCNCYLRNHSEVPHKDFNNDKQLSAKNVIVQFQKESQANDGYENNLHLLYGTTGEGKAIIFMDGLKVEGKWVKKSRTTRTKFVDLKNKEIVFNKGVIWIQTVPLEADVKY